MNKLLLLLFFCLSITMNAQKLGKQDSVNILFKAKLLTTNEYGISYSKESILQNIEQQKATFLKTGYKKFVFIKVDFSQKYNLLDRGTIVRFGNCSYYLAFNIEISKFYKLGGFNIPDIDEFIKDVNGIEEKGIFNGLGGGEIEEIDIDCLYDYSLLSSRKRRKKGYSCLGNCNEIVTTTTHQ